VFGIHFRHSVSEIKNQEFPTPLKLKAPFTSGTPVSPTYKSELRHSPQDCNYIIFQSEYLKTHNLSCLLASLHQCTQYRYTWFWTERNGHVAAHTASHYI